ncbi:hypothetical protein, partial [Tibeticola sediminis]|uniref:hypothetical protein n=1 Tax=Tibeticola sediminis TaxID=1917811 RepID=UPI001B863263
YNAERRTTPSASVPRYPSSCNINPSAKGTGLKQMFDPLLFWCHNMWLRFIGEQTSAQHKHLEWFGVWTTGPRLIWRVPRGATGTSWEYQHDPD